MSDPRDRGYRRGGRALPPDHYLGVGAWRYGDGECQSRFATPPETLPVDVTPEELGLVDPLLAHHARVGQARVQTYVFGRCQVIEGDRRCESEISYPTATMCPRHEAVAAAGE